MTTVPDPKRSLARVASSFQYNPRTRQYETASGSPVSQKAIRGAVDQVVDAEALKIRAVSERLVAGEINIPQWQIETTAILKNLHVAVGLAANGGYDNTSNADLSYIASQMKKQYQYLRSFAKQVRNGSQPLNGTLVARAALYAQSARGTYEDVARRAAKNAGMTQERRVLGVADHCDGCVALAAKGWQKINTLPNIGEDTPCRGNCRCMFEYK